jgi:hypothetical protein
VDLAPVTKAEDAKIVTIEAAATEDAAAVVEEKEKADH